MKSIALLVGARPNYMKIAPLWRVIHEKSPQIRQTLIHTGQHYDETLSKVFFRDLDMPEPDVCLEVGSGTHAEQTARVMLSPVHDASLCAMHSTLMATNGRFFVIVGGAAPATADLRGSYLCFRTLLRGRTPDELEARA